MYSDDNTIRIWSMDRDRAMKQRTETYAMDEYEISDGEEEEVDGDGGGVAGVGGKAAVCSRKRKHIYANDGSSANRSFYPTANGQQSSHYSNNNNNNKRPRDRQEHESSSSSSSWSTSSSQPGVQSSIFRYLQRSRSPSQETP